MEVPDLGGFAGDPRGGVERQKRFSPSLFLEFSSSCDLAREAGLLAVLDKADIEFDCVIQRYSEAIVLFAGGGLVQNRMRGPDSSQPAYFRV